MLTALHAAKAELAEELEANLKQLKTVLEETQRIQRQMEAVLKEARAEARLKELAGEEGQPDKAQGKGKEKAGQQHAGAQNDQRSQQKPARQAGRSGPDSAGAYRADGQQQQAGGGAGGGRASGGPVGGQGAGQVRGQAGRQAGGQVGGQSGGQAGGNSGGHSGAAQTGAGHRPGANQRQDAAGSNAGSRKAPTPWSQISTDGEAGQAPQWMPPESAHGQTDSWQPPAQH